MCHLSTAYLYLCIYHFLNYFNWRMTTILRWSLPYIDMNQPQAQISVIFINPSTYLSVSVSTYYLSMYHIL